MLVVSRKVGEKIVIDGGIEVVIVGIRGDKVRVGVEAPKSVTVVREELVKGAKK
jgi:carbon storage regulator